MNFDPAVHKSSGCHPIGKLNCFRHNIECDANNGLGYSYSVRLEFNH